MRKFTLLIIILCSFDAFSQNEELKKQLYETGKVVLKNQVSNALKDQLGNQLGQFGGEAVMTLFNVIEKQSQKAKIRSQIEDANNQLLHLKMNPGNGLNRLKISPDSKYLVTAESSKNVTITNLADGQKVLTIEPDKDVLDIKFHPTNNWMALGMSGQIDIWNLNDLTLIQSLELKGGDIGLAPLSESASLIYFHPTELDQIIYFNPKKTFTCYDFLTGESIYMSDVKAPSTAVNALKLTYNIYQSMGRTQGFLKSWFPTPDGRHIVIQTRKSTYLWDPYSEKEVIEYQRNKGTKDYVGIPYLILNSELYTSSEDEMIVYDVNNGNVKNKVTIPMATTLGQAHEKKIIFSPDKEYFMVAGRDMLGEQKVINLDFYHTSTLAKLISFPGDIQDFREYYYYDWSNNGKYIVKYCASCKDESVVVYDMEEAESKQATETSTEVPQQPELTQPKKDKYEELRELKKLLDEGVLTQDEFNAEKKKILGN